MINILTSASTMEVAHSFGIIRLVLLYNNLSEYLNDVKKTECHKSNVYSHITNIQTYLTNEINLFSWIHHKSTPGTILNIHLFPINVLTTKKYIYSTYSSVYGKYSSPKSVVLGRPQRGRQSIPDSPLFPLVSHSQTCVKHRSVTGQLCLLHVLDARFHPSLDTAGHATGCQAVC